MPTVWRHGHHVLMTAKQRKMKGEFRSTQKAAGGEAWGTGNGGLTFSARVSYLSCHGQPAYIPPYRSTNDYLCERMRRRPPHPNIYDKTDEEGHVVAPCSLQQLLNAHFVMHVLISPIFPPPRKLCIICNRGVPIRSYRSTKINREICDGIARPKYVAPGEKAERKVVATMAMSGQVRSCCTCCRSGTSGTQY